MEYVMRYCTEHRVDVLCVLEHWLDSPAEINVCRMSLSNPHPNFRWYGVYRKAQANGSRGGVGFMVFDSRLRVGIVHQNPHGALGVQIQREGSAALGILGIYNPPHNSVYNRCHPPQLPLSPTLLRDSRQAVTHMRTRCETVIVTGDLNMRAGTYRDRQVDDTSTRNGRKREMHDFCDSLRMEPAHGKRGTHTVATNTSRSVNGGSGRAEVDFILTPWDMPLERVTPIQPPSWEEIPSGTHRPIAIDFCAAARPEAPRPARQRTTTTNRTPVPAYPHKVWHKVQIVMHETALQLLPTAETETDVNVLLNAVVTMASAGLQVIDETCEKRFHTSQGLHRPWPGPPPTAEMTEMLKSITRLKRRLRKRKGRRPLPEHRRAADKAKLGKLKRAFQRSKKKHEQRGSLPRQTAQIIHGLRGYDEHQMYKLLKLTVSTSNEAPHALIENPELHLSYWKKMFQEDRELPSGATSPERLAEIPVATHGMAQLLQPAQWREVHMFMQPMHSREVGLVYCCMPGCRLCSTRQAHCRAHLEHPHEIPPPEGKAALNTSRASGPAGLPAAIFKWPHVEEWWLRLRYRKPQCQLMALLCTACVQTSRVPTVHDFSGHYTIGLLKPSVPGFPSDPQNPSDYRPLTIGNTVERVIELFLHNRLAHWAEENNLIPSTQAGFREHHSAEHQVYALMETITHEWRRGRDCYAVFIDFKKAYDSVHLGALWTVLDRMGLPANLLNLLKEWAGNRTTIITIGDLRSEAFKADKGTPQGSVLSPLLFNLFISSLHTTLQTVAGWEGVRLTAGPGSSYSVTVRDLFYADDLALLAKSLAQAQAALDAVWRWAREWGLELGIGKDKTAAMLFRADAKEAVIPEQKLHAGEQEIPWVARYKYLGYILQPNLKNDDIVDDTGAVIVEGMAARLRNKLVLLRNMFFTGNRTVSALPPTTQIQFASSLLTGAVSYLLSVIPLTETELNRLDSQINMVMKDILGLPRSTPTQIVRAESPILSFSAIRCMHRHRLLHHFNTTPFQESIAAQIYHVTRHETWKGGARNVRLQPWTQQTGSILAKKRKLATDLGLPFDDNPRGFWDVRRAAAVVGRNAAYAEWLSSLPHAEMGSNQRPITHPRPAAAASLYRPSLAPATGLGNVPTYTSLAITGPGCSGALLSLCSMGKEFIIPAMRARLGVQAMIHWPFVEVGTYKKAKENATGHPTPNGQPCTSSVAAELTRNARSGCEHCRGATGQSLPEDVWHLMFDCVRPRLIPIREQLLATATNFMQRLCRRLHNDVKWYESSFESFEPHGPQLEPAFLAIQHALTQLTPDLEWNNDTGKWLIYRLLLGLPLPASASTATTTDSSIGAVAQALGIMFEKICLPSRFLKHVSNMCARWSNKWLMAIADVRSGRKAT